MNGELVERMKEVSWSKFPEVKTLLYKKFSDDRGWFSEVYRKTDLVKLDLEDNFVQDNHSFSAKGTIRGMHFHRHHKQVKLVRCPVGKIIDVVVDVRPDSPTYLQWESFVLGSSPPFSNTLLYIPGGFAHGFMAVEDSHVLYKCSTEYDPENELGFRFDDPDIGIEWPTIHWSMLEKPETVDGLIVSKKDREAPYFKDLEV